MSSGGTRVSIWEMFETWPAVRVWIAGTDWPTWGIGNSPTGFGVGIRLYW